MNRRLAVESLESRQLLHAAGVMSGYVFMDTNDDSARSAGELGVPGVVINLAGNDSSGESVEASTISDDNGFYSFEELEPGNYQLSKRQSSALRDGRDSSPVDGVAIGDNRIAGVQLEDDATLIENNFGESALDPRFISIRWLFSSTPPQRQMLRETVALAEELNGEEELAQAIRDGGSEVPEDINTAPVANSDRFTIDAGGVLTISAARGVLSNDTDAENQALAAAVSSGPANGSLTLNRDGSFTYTPDANFDGIDTFRYTASDGILTDSAAVTITVNPVVQRMTTTIAASKDATLYERADGSVANGAGEYIFVGKTAEQANSLRRALIAFDIASEIPANATIEDVTLELNMSRTIVGPFDVSLHRVTTNWDQGTSDQTGEEGGANPVPPTAGDATWIHGVYDSELWDNPGGDFDSVSSATTSIEAVGPYEWNSSQMKDDVQSWLDNPSQNQGWILITDETVVSAKRFDSRENGTTENEPRLVVEYSTPDEPDAPDPPVTNEPFGPVTPGSFQDPGVLGVRTDLEPGALPLNAGHVTTAVDYTGYSNPPTYGPHHGFLLDAQRDSITPRPTGVYQTEQPDEDLVHNLEHAHVWISYNPTLISRDDLAALEQLVTDGGTNSGVILTPRAANADAIALASWARLLTLDSFDSAQIRNFVEANRGKSPEGFMPAGQKSDASSSENLSDGLDHTPPVEIPNTAPVVANDSFQTDEGATLNVNVGQGVLANDSDPENDSLTAVVGSDPDDGSLSLNTDGSFTYSPDSGFTGVDSFTYTANDGELSSNPATVSITVSATNEAPVAGSDSYTTDEDQTLEVASSSGVLSNDSDPDGDALTVTVNTDVANGQLTLNPDGSFNYRPDADFSGSDSFTYSLSDETASTVGTVTITVNPVDDTESFSVTVEATKDTTLVENPNGEAANGSGPGVFSGRTNRNANPNRRGLFAFDLDGIPAGAIINNVSMSLNMSKTIAGESAFSLHRVTSDWGEGASSGGGFGAPAQTNDATWVHTFFASSNWNTPGGDFDSTASATTPVGGRGSYSWSSSQMIADVRAWVDDPSSNFGWILIGDETQQSSKRFDSRESPSAENRPQLVIDYDA